MATGFPVKANYATGDVLTAANMNDLSGTVNYLQYMTPRNACLNSNFSVWQRGTSIAVGAANTYTADRWQGTRGLVAGETVSRQATGDTTNLPNIQYCARVQRDSGNTSTAALQFNQYLETVNSIPFSGKQVTLSFYARAGANYSSASNALGVYLVSGTGTDQNYVVGWTGGATVASTSATLTTTWQRFSITGTVASNATQLCILTSYTPVGTAGANDYFEITGVQLELGSVANTYMPNQPTYQGELAACQRYYYRQTSGTTYGTFATGAISSTTGAYCGTTFPVQMRVAPTSFEYSSLRVTDKANFGVAVTSASLSTADTTPNLGMAQYIVASGLTAYRPCFIDSNNISTGYIAFNAEL